MTIQTQLTAKDYLVAQRLHFRPKPLLRWAIYTLLTLFAFLLLQEVWIMVRGDALPRGWWILPAGLAYGACLFLLVLPWRVRRIFKSQPVLAELTRIEITEDGLRLKTSRGQLRFKWSMLKKWKRNRECLLVYHSTMLFHILPRRSFASGEDFERLATTLRAHLGPEQP